MKILLTVLLCFPLLATARIPAVFDAAEQWQIQGSGEMRWFGFSIYGARLWRSTERWQPQAPYALELTYRRSISAEQLVNTSIEEIERLGEQDTQRLQQWRLALDRVLPSVREHDVIIGLHEPGRGARFYFNGSLVGKLDDARLAAAFFAIWLDPRTKAPDLRARLLAEIGNVP